MIIIYALFHICVLFKIISILDLFHNKQSGLFTLLNDECTFQNPSTDNFDSKLRSAWQRNVNTPISWNTRGRNPKENRFVIRHFTNDVVYSTVWFIQTLLPKVIIFGNLIPGSLSIFSFVF